MAAGGRQPSPEELAEDMAELKSMLADLHGKIDQLPYLRIDVYEARHKSLRSEVALQLANHEAMITSLGNRVDKVEERHTWVARTAVAGLLLPVIVALVVGALIAGGAS